MQIKQISKSIKTLPQAVTRIRFIEKGVESLVREGKETTLEIVSGDLKKITPRTFRTLIRSMVQAAHKYEIPKIAFEFDLADFPGLHTYGEGWAMSTIAENVFLAHYTFNAYKSKPKRQKLTEVTLITKIGKEGAQGLKRGVVVGMSANVCRDIANTSGGDMTPKVLAERAKDILKDTEATVTVLDEKKMRELGMGGVLGVGQGALERPRFIVIEYWGKGKARSGKNKSQKEEGPLVLVGKGVTFDSGGLQVKPGMAMYEMHMDMSGGAAVIAAIRAIAKLELKKNVVGLIPAVENAVSDKAIRPGDVLTMMSGKTVEVLHTDAEGRIILADALTYAKQYEPKLVVDVATLTGASLVAVGQHAHVIMTKDRTLEDRFRELGEETGDYTFPLPLWEEYTQYTKGVHADITNVPAGDSPKAGGTINGGTFLSHFAEKMPWVHIDMAPRMTSIPADKLAKGATGEPTRLLVKIAETF